MSSQIGKISQIIGPVIDVSFDTTTMQLPKILDALEITKENGQKLFWSAKSTSVKILSERLPWTVVMGCAEGWM